MRQKPSTYLSTQATPGTLGPGSVYLRRSVVDDALVLDGVIVDVDACLLIV